MLIVYHSRDIPKLCILKCMSYIYAKNTRISCLRNIFVGTPNDPQLLDPHQKELRFNHFWSTNTKHDSSFSPKLAHYFWAKAMRPVELREVKQLSRKTCPSPSHPKILTKYNGIGLHWTISHIYKEGNTAYINIYIYILNIDAVQTYLAELYPKHFPTFTPFRYHLLKKTPRYERATVCRNSKVSSLKTGTKGPETWGLSRLVNTVVSR